jgi:hypothetical protein
VLGAFVLCFRKPSSASEQAGVRRLVEEVSRVVRDGLNGGSTYGGWDGVCVAVGMKRAVLGWVRDGEADGGGEEMGAEEWEDICSEFGFEYVDGEDRGKGKNKYGGLWGLIIFYPLYPLSCSDILFAPARFFLLLSVKHLSFISFLLPLSDSLGRTCLLGQMDSAYLT